MIYVKNEFVYNQSSSDTRKCSYYESMSMFSYMSELLRTDLLNLYAYAPECINDMKT